MRKLLIYTTLIVVLGSCKVYKANIMFQTEQEWVVDSLRNLNKNADENYVLQANDYISIKVYTNNGERIIDPDFELLKGVPINQFKDEKRYLIRSDGFANLPMVGQIKLAGYTLKQCDSALSVAYTKYYFGVYVTTSLLNKRAIVIGPQMSKVIPLENDNITVIELIALYGGMPTDGRATNIRLIRGNLQNPDVQIIDLSTIDGMKKASLNVEPNDIVYIEPVKRIFSMTLQDIYPLISVFLTIFSILILVFSKN